ncbi:MAG: alkaline phosphatase family protein [Anaerolineales bacterium]|nr:alkaline phosphatase family protein [Anaerolineales bacterium]
MTIPSFLRSRFFIAGCLFAAAGFLAILWTVRLMESVYDYRSPLSSAPPLVQEPLGHAVSERLVIILVDGLREDVSHDPDLMPYLQTLREQGAWATMHSRPFSYSQPGYSTLLIGAWPDLNDGPALNMDRDAIRVWTQDNLFSAVHRTGGVTFIAAHDPFEKMIPAPDISEGFFTDHCDQFGDNLILNKALARVQSGGQNLMLIHFCQVDDAGDNRGGPNGAAYKDAATRVDAMIQMLASMMDFSKDTLMIVSDHGQIDAGGHGGPEADNLVEPFILAGAGVWPGYFGQMQMVDVAPTAAALLGAAIPSSSQGQVLWWMLTLDQEVLDALPAAAGVQQKQLYEYYTRMIGTGNTTFTAKLDLEEENPVVKYQAGIERARGNRLGGEVMGRAFLLFLPAAAAIYLGWKFFSRRLLERVFLFLLYALAFSAVYLFAFQQTFSLSRAPNQTVFILAIVVSSAAGFLAAWLADVIWRKTLSAGMEEAAGNTLALAGLFLCLLSLLVAAHFLLNGTVVRWTLPEVNSAFFGLLAMIQIFTLAILGGVLAGAAALAKRPAVREAGVKSHPKRSVSEAAPKQPAERAATSRRRTGRGGRRR